MLTMLHTYYHPYGYDAIHMVLIKLVQKAILLYYRIPAADVRMPIEQFVEEGIIIPVRVRGWHQQAYLHKDARAGRKIEGAALLSPFDPLIWRRPRTERLFGFRYRLEIYTPAHKRKHGYYVLPFLLDGALVARVDLKADRNAGTLIVQRTHFEPGAPRCTVERLFEQLRLMASWLGLSDLAIAPAAAIDPSPSYPPRWDPAGICRAGTLANRDGPL